MRQVYEKVRGSKFIAKHAYVLTSEMMRAGFS